MMITLKNTILCGHVTRVNATEHGSFVSIMNEWYTLDQHGKHSYPRGSIIRMALNNNCGLK